MAVNVDRERFEEYVSDALDAIPEDLLALLENCAVIIEDHAPVDEPDLLGLYDGVPITERDTGYGGVLPDRIFIYRLPTLAICDTVEEVVAEVYTTVMHEIAHFFGIDDDRLEELGYA